jgi:hypothetical protein
MSGMTKKEYVSMSMGDEFLKAYIEAALWSSVDDKYEPLDSNYNVHDLARETLVKFTRDCKKFCIENKLFIGARRSQAGHDFWLTRNSHGAGFWDGDWPKAIGEPLTDAAHKFGEVSLFVHRGRIYQEG